MAIIGVQMMMVKEQVAEQGMFEVLTRIKDLGYEAVEVSQIPMDEKNTAELERGVTELGLMVGALSVALKGGPTATGDNLEDNYDKIVDDCRRLGASHVRIGMMPFTAMASKQACQDWAAECELAAQRLLADGVQLCYHNHHVDLAKFDGETLFDIVRRVAPTLHFEVDLHWVQRGGMNPVDMLERYTGVCDLIHLKDYRVRTLPPESLELLADPERRGEFFNIFRNDVVQFAEVGQGTMNWPAIIPAAEKSGAAFFFVEQDDTYGRDPFDCLKDSKEYLAGIGY
jgi:sugar phosphate isomerase/epimerase